MSNLLIQILASVIVAVVGYRLKSLTISGAAGTIIVGSAVSVGFGYRGLLLLGLFFASSSLWSKFKSGNKDSLQNKVEKGEQRDIIQVLANGGVASVASLLFIWTDSLIWLRFFIGSIAAANADTWASEIGTLSKKKPFLITKMRRVDAGTSGAVSLLGTIAGFLGSFLIAVVSFFVWPELSVILLVGLTLVGFSGNVIDTIMGATVQVVYKCSVCSLETEKKVHCGQETTYLKGLRFCNNDVVNFFSILFASGLGTYFLSHIG
ncbi:DUF92 domain-containing protein [Bacillus timonensis]|uniref:DUF92 domain-containing protein n=1 Tax=Bacillus timonensis TaxID=1033734 RepID=A0A4S3Q0R1_9BACI|nr:DUF92 domain-containing protein [Bacillus timonensis]THE15466.1 DUF92 domain-containing protein [Bacillus timonensis]